MPLPAVAPARRPDSPPVDKRVDPDSLPVWALPSSISNASSARTTIYAVAASLDALIIVTRPRGTQLMTRTLGAVVTGRVDAPSGEAAYAALLALTPDPSAFAPVKLDGKGPTVNLSVSAEPFADVVRIIGDVTRENIVYPASAEAVAYDLDVKAAAAPVLTRLAALAGLDEQRAGNIVYLVPHGQHAPVASTLRERVTVSLEAVAATPADVVRVLSALTPVPFHVACTGGTAVTVHLRHVDVGAALAAIAFRGGLPIEPGDAACPLEPTPAGVPPASAQLTVVAGLDVAHAAMLVDGSTRWLETQRDRVDIGPGYVSFKLADGQQGYMLRSPVSDERPWTDAPWRLAATITSGPDQATAIADTATGSHSLRTRSGVEIAIVRGAVTLANTQQPALHVLEQP